MRHHTRRQAWWGFQAGLVLIALTLLACTANDTLFIHLTVTPSPTLTSTPLTIETKFKIGDSAVIFGFLSTMQAIPALPRPFSVGSAGTANCTNSARIKILDVSKNTADPADPVIYYKVSCSGVQGWLPEPYLSRFGAGDSAQVKSVSSKGADVFESPNKVDTAIGVCPDDTPVKALQLSINQAAAAMRTGDNPQGRKDQNIYIKVVCGNLTGFVRESDLSPINRK